MTVAIRPYGRRALLAEPTDRADLLALAAAARELPGVVEVVPAARTVLVVCADTAAVAEALSTVDLATVGGAGCGSAPTEIVLNVVYDGPDLAAVSAETGLRADEVIDRHARATYVVAFCGFAPGFAYLTGLDPQLHVPRLAEPRTRVPSGAVGIAGEFTGVYPRSSPGGWRLVGRTAARLWDVERNPPALLVPGARVRFRVA